MLKPLLLVISIIGGIVCGNKATSFRELLQLIFTSGIALGMVIGAALTLYTAGRELRSQDIEIPSPKPKDWLRLGLLPTIFLLGFGGLVGAVIYWGRQLFS